MILTAKGKKRKLRLQAGVFESVVTDICFHPEYISETAILVRYLLTDAKGNDFNFSEVFHNNERNQRSQKFFDYLVENGIALESFTDFKGCCEKLTLKKNPSKNGVLLSIAEREFISHSRGEDDGF